jgi:hypothetical protein
MSEVEEIECYGGGASVLALTARKLNRDTATTVSPPISFDRRELNQILRVYGRKVAEGEWRDYAIDHLREKAIFSVFRRTSEVPLYQIVKQPKLARRQGAYAIIAATGQILKRGHDLTNILRFIDRPLKLVVA